MKAALDRGGVVNQDPALRQAAEQSFYNTSEFTMRDLRARMGVRILPQTAEGR